MSQVTTKQAFIDALPTACPRLQAIYLHLTINPLRLFRLRVCENLRSIHIKTFTNGDMIAIDLCDISQYIAPTRQHPLETIRFEAFEITDANVLNRIFKLQELVDLKLEDIRYIRQTEFDAAVSDFRCSKLENLYLRLTNVSPESQLLPVLGAIAGENSLQNLSLL